MPDVYKLCRNNDSSIQRHIQRRHQGKEVPVIRLFNDKEENVSKARDFVKKWESLAPNEKAKLKGKTKSDLKGPQKKNLSQTVPDAPAKPKVFHPISIPKSVVPNSNPPDDTKQSREESVLHSKIDMLISEFREFKLQSKSSKGIQNMPTPLSAIGAKCSHEVSELLLKWPDIKNIIDLVNCCRHIRFFPGDVIKGVLSVVRCETCYQYLEYNKNGIRGFINTKPEQVAKKGLGG